MAVSFSARARGGVWPCLARRPAGVGPRVPKLSQAASSVDGAIVTWCLVTSGPSGTGPTALISVCAYVDSRAMDEITILQAEVLRTLANPRRLEILHALADGPIEVGRLAMLIGATQPNVSQHLAILRSAGIVEAQRDGREVRYRLADPGRDGRVRPDARLSSSDRLSRLGRPRCRPLREPLEVTPMDEPLNLVLFSGTDDKLQAAAVLTAGAAALGKPVNVFLQYWALDAFRADRIGADHGLAPEAGAGGSRRRRRAARRRSGQLGGDACARRRSSAASTSRPARCRWTCSHLEPDRPRSARRRRGGRDRLLPQRRRGPGRLHLATKEATDDRSQITPTGRRSRAVVPDADRQDGPGDEDDPVRRPASRSSRPIPGPSRTSRRGRGRPATSSSSRSADGGVYRFVLRRK